jgi:mono/diheme cytochrome c family protein
MLKDYRLLLALTFIAVIAVIGSVVRGLRPEYVTWQKKYYQKTDLKDGDIGIKQINVETQAGQLIDRCTTCHLGASNRNAIGFEAPLAFHPVIVPGEDKDPHDLNKMGCVVCHDGNGRATERTDAHGQFHDWYAPLLPGTQAQANCAQCHDTVGQDLRGADLFNRGKRLYIERSCYACHTIKGVSSGKSAPDLTDAGGKFDLFYLIESIVEPTANTAVSAMPRFDWVTNSDDVMALALYLKGQRLRKYRDPDTAPIGMQGSQARFASFDTPGLDVGRQIFTGIGDSDLPVKGGCVNCHAYREADGTLQGGNIGPDLTMTYRARGADFIVNHVRNPRGDVMDSPMPPFANILGDVELESIVRFLQSFTYRLDAGRPPRGELLYETYCLSCHGKDLDGRGDLAALLDPLPRNLKKARFLTAYRDRLKKSIQEGITGTDMAPWGPVLSDNEIDAVLDHIFEQAGMDRQEFKRIEVTLPQPGDPERRAWGEPASIEAGDAARGRTAFQKFCASCHGKLANGKGPEAYFLVHPLPRNLISKPFMNQPSLTDERLYESILLGVPGTSMPPHDHLKDQTILDIISFLRSNTESEP